MIRILAVAAFALPIAAQAQETLPLAELLSNTHIHGIAEGPSGHESVTLATHHGIFTIDLSAQTARLMGSSRDDFMGFSQVPGGPGKAFASGHPASGGNLGVIRTEDGVLPPLSNSVRSMVAKELATTPAGVVASAITGFTSYSSQAAGDPLRSCSEPALDRNVLMAAADPMS